MNAVQKFGFNKYLSSKNLGGLDICTIRDHNIFSYDLSAEVLILPFFQFGSKPNEYDFFHHAAEHAGMELQNEVFSHLFYQRNDNDDDLAITCGPYYLSGYIRAIKVLPIQLTFESVKKSITNALLDASFIYPEGKAILPFFGSSFLSLEEQVEAYHQALIDAQWHIHRLREIQIVLPPELENKEVVSASLRTAIPEYFWK